MPDFWEELNVVYSELLFLFELQRNENIRANTESCSNTSFFTVRTQRGRGQENSPIKSSAYSPHASSVIR